MEAEMEAGAGSPEKRGKSRKIKRIIIVSVAVVIAVALLPFALSGIVYSSVFGRRFETEAVRKYTPADFEGLVETRERFKTDRGVELQGYFYTREGLEPKGLVVVCHGFGGGGCNAYMDSADVFTRAGYAVFMFDAAGNDLSGGTVTGVPQYTVDLVKAIEFLDGKEEIRGLPKMLFGHSMGGFSILNALNFVEDSGICAVCEMSGFCESSDVIKIEAVERMGRVSLVLLPYVKLYEALKFGKYSTKTAVTGLKNSDARVVVIHGELDDTIPFETGYGRLYGEFGNDPRFEFIALPERGHNNVDWSDAAIEYVAEFNKGYSAWYASENGEITAEDRAGYFAAHLDRKAWSSLPDEGLYAKIVAVFDEAAEDFTGK